MKQNQIGRLAAAAGTGGWLVATYAGGRAPGHKRRILVQSVDVEADQMTVIENGATKTYFLSKTTLVDEADPAPWMSDDAGKLLVVDPVAYFSGWTHLVGAVFWSAFGVFKRDVIDKEKTKLARDAALARGIPSAEVTKRVRVMRSEYVVNTPPVYRFEIGDLMWVENGWFQVMAVDLKVEGVILEIHMPWRDGRIGYSMPAAEFERCMRTGINPDRKYRIGVTQRSSLVLLNDVI